MPPLPDLTLSKTHTGNFAQGQIGASYQITVTSATTGEGGIAAGNTVTVTDTPPTGLTVTAIAGSGWTCAPLPHPQPTCSRSDALAAGLSYPPITVTVTVAANATSPQINSAAVTTTAIESNSANNSATDSTIVVSGTFGSLTIARRGSGSGTVASLDGGINCGIDCANAYVNSSGIALLATPVAGSVFTGWLGGCTGTISCTATISGAATVSATFALSPIGTQILDIDGNTSFDALTDGLMILRALFGLTGTAVTHGAITPGVGRDTAQIGVYLSDIRPYLDVDGNGVVDALTDGLLIMRYLFGLSGAALTQGAIGPRATRITDTQLQDYLAALKL